MSFLSLFLISLGLGMDSLSVSVTAGFRSKTPSINEMFRVSGVFGVFHVLMPLLGWAIGLEFKKIIIGVDHWIAFALLSIIGIRMIYAGLNKKIKPINITKKRNLLVLAVATSIDALVIGISLAIVGTAPLQAAILIGFVVFSMCAVGYLVGEKIGRFINGKLEIVGGVILISIGLKILLEHLL